MPASSSLNIVTEPARTLPVYGEFDVVVIGGGPAGLAASVSAAKRGARTLLVERYGFLGGMGTAGGVTNFAGLYGRKNGEMQQLVHGVVDDLLARIEALGGLNQPQDGMQGRIRVRSYDVSAYKCAADQLLLSAGVQILFHAWAAAVLMDGQTVQALVVETKSGRQAIRGHRFIDCSGDADVAHFAKVPFELGDGRGSALFPSTMFRVGHVDAGRALEAVGDFKAINDLMAQSEARQPGRYKFPRKGAILRPQKNPTEWRANVTQIRNAGGTAMDATDARQLSEGEIEGRRQITEYFRFLKSEVPGFEQSAIIDIAPPPPGRHTRNAAHLRRVRADRRRHPVLGSLRRCHRHQRLAHGNACRWRHQLGLSARRNPGLQRPALAHAGAQGSPQPAGRGPLRFHDA